MSDMSPQSDKGTRRQFGTNRQEHPFRYVLGQSGCLLPILAVCSLVGAMGLASYHKARTHADKHFGGNTNSPSLSTNSLPADFRKDAAKTTN